MSKSLGTGVDPLELMDKYGTDATRFGLCGMATATQDVRLQEAREPGWDANTPEEGRTFPFFVQGRNFANKVWNASRFALMHVHADERGRTGPRDAGRPLDSLTLYRDGRGRDAGLAVLPSGPGHADALRFLLERILRLVPGDDQAGAARRRCRGRRCGTRSTLAYVLENALRLLHPFMPFITEEIWQQLPHSAGARESLMISTWPAADPALCDAEAEEEMAFVMDIIASVRKQRAEQGIAPAQKVAIRVATDSNPVHSLVAKEQAVLLSLTRGEEVSLTGTTSRQPGEQFYWRNTPVEVTISHEISAEERQREREKIERELQKVQAETEQLSARLANANFAEKAPTAVVAKARAELAELQARRVTLEERLAGPHAHGEEQA